MSNPEPEFELKQKIKIPWRENFIFKRANLWTVFPDLPRIDLRVDDNRHGRLPLFALGDGLSEQDCLRFIRKLAQDKASVERFNVFMGEPKPKQEKRRSSTTVTNATNAKQRKSVV
uniref:Uncharacterized protein n=1 Tax=Globodera pallida TaxID=36090 RepID=A0A183CI93_GLOPA